eukprot:2848115-Amphidinium_carterae.2
MQHETDVCCQEVQVATRIMLASATCKASARTIWWILCTIVRGFLPCDCFTGIRLLPIRVNLMGNAKENVANSRKRVMRQTKKYSPFRA